MNLVHHKLMSRFGCRHNNQRYLRLNPTPAIKSLHSQVRKTIRNKGHFPSDEAAIKLIYLALRNITAKWKRAPKEWHTARTQLAIQFGERFISA